MAKGNFDWKLNCRKVSDIQRFIVLSHQRSGTTYLCNHILCGHPEIFSFDELLNQPGHLPIKKALEANKLPEITAFKYRLLGKLRDDIYRYDRYIEDFFQKSAAFHNKRCIGFKLFPEQISPILMEHLFKKPELKILYLKRKNIVQSAISMYLLIHFNQKDHRYKSELPEFEIDIDWCEKWIVDNRYRHSRCLKKLKETDREYLPLTYENLFNLETINSIYKFLGCKPLEAIPSGMKKLNPPSRYKKITNLKEFEKRLCNEYNGYLS